MPSAARAIFFFNARPASVSLEVVPGRAKQDPLDAQVFWQVRICRSRPKLIDRCKLCSSK